MTAKMNIMIPKTKVKFPKAPTVLPMMEMSKFNVGQDFANLKTLSWKKRINNIISNIRNRSYFQSIEI